MVGNEMWGMQSNKKDQDKGMKRRDSKKKVDKIWDQKGDRS